MRVLTACDHMCGDKLMIKMAEQVFVESTSTKKRKSCSREKLMVVKFYYDNQRKSLSNIQEIVMTIAFLSFKYELLSQCRIPNALIDVNDALHSVLFSSMQNAYMCSIVLPAMLNVLPSILKPHTLLNASFFLLGACFLAVHS